jgi:hypothetical protein
MEGRHGMGLNDAFDAYQKVVDADAAQVRLARGRRDIFKEALNGEPDVQDTWGSGSLRRSTQLQPVHDVDLVVEFDAAQHPDWVLPGDSSEDALEHVRARVRALLGDAEGTVDQLVRLAKPRNRAVKCFIDPPEDPESFTVDVMPVFRQHDGTLLMPSKRDGRWSTADPEYLIREVADRQGQWSYFRPMIRTLKRWRLGVPVTGKIKSLVVEILALECLPPGPNRAEALRAFFTAAAAHSLYIEDPAGHCGLIQPDLDVTGLRGALENAADAATAACTAAANSNTDEALRAWQTIFGPDFPAPAAPKKPSPAVTGPALITPRLVKDSPQG